MMALGGAASAQAATTVTVAPGSPGSSPTDNNWPFGHNNWGNHMGFIYKNVQPFSLKAGDTIAFDLAQPNNVVPQLEIGLAQTTVSGGDLPAAPFTPVVPNTVVPTGSGNTIANDYDLAYKVAVPYTFPGGGLIIKFSNKGTALAGDGVASDVFQNLQTTTADSSGLFAFRFAQDADGAPPWSLQDTDRISGFRLIIEDPASAPVTKKKCKKKKKKGKAAESAAKKKKKCKKKKKGKK